MTIPAAQIPRSGARGLLLPGLATLVALAILVSLGNWQMRRLAWKEALIARVEARVALPPIDLPPAAEWASLDLDGLEYRPVRVRGRYAPQDAATLQIRVFTSLGDPKGPYGGPGYLHFDAFEPEAGGTVFVNRGFVPMDWAGEIPEPGGGPQDLVGLLRVPDPETLYSPDPNPDAGLYFRRAPQSFRPGVSGWTPPLAPFYLDLAAAHTPATGLPQAGETRLVFTNNHLGYAITWYGLALALAGVFASFAWTRLRGQG